MQVTDRMKNNKHIVYERSYYSNTDYITEKECIHCDKCNKCLYYTYIYLNKITDKYKYTDISEFKCPCPSILLKDILDKKLHSIILSYLL